MPHVVIKKNCIVCGGCLVYCKNKAIHLINGKADIDRDKCNDCGNCVGRCLARCIVTEEEYNRIYPKCSV